MPLEESDFFRTACLGKRGSSMCDRSDMPIWIRAHRVTPGLDTAIARVMSFVPVKPESTWLPSGPQTGMIKMSLARLGPGRTVSIMEHSQELGRVLTWSKSHG